MKTAQEIIDAQLAKPEKDRHELCKRVVLAMFQEIKERAEEIADPTDPHWMYTHHQWTVYIALRNELKGVSMSAQAPSANNP